MLSVCLLLWKHLLLIKLFGKPHQMSVPAFLRSHWSIFANVHSWPALGKAFRDTGGFRKDGTSSLKRVTGGIFTICNWFHRSKQKFYFDFLLRKTAKNCENHQRSFKSTVLIFWTFKKTFISWNYPFKEEEQRPQFEGHDDQWPYFFAGRTKIVSINLTLSKTTQMRYIPYFNIKGTVSPDFRLLVSFMNQFPPNIWVYQYSHVKFFQKFAEIFAARGAPLVSTTPVANGKNLQAEKF